MMPGMVRISRSQGYKFDEREFRGSTVAVWYDIVLSFCFSLFSVSTRPSSVDFFFFISLPTRLVCVT